MEIRLHGRGGQGGVTCAKILAAIYARLGQSVQAFGDYAGERSGAPVRAYARMSESEVKSRNKVYEPDHLLVLDPSLLGPELVQGLKVGGTLLINSPQPPEHFIQDFPGYRVATVDATGIARAHGIGTRTVVIVNTTIVGAFASLFGISQREVEATYAELGLSSNLEASKEAYAKVRVRELDSAAMSRGLPAPQLSATPEVLDLLDHRVGEPTGLKTGAWRTQMPRYIKAMAPCTASCPAGNDVEAFVQALARGESGEALAAAVLSESTPLAASCGRVCPAFCKANCNRADLDGAVDTRALERWIGDHSGIARKANTNPDSKEKKSFAIVGGGPAGLSAAYQLIREGHRVVIFEADALLGGVLRTGIPNYRLPREVLDREIKELLALGVEAQTGHAVDQNQLKALAAEFDGVILALGLQRLQPLELPGAQLRGVEQGIHFLRRVNLELDPSKTDERDEALGGHVVVLGGGNTAMDCARSALRRGADKVSVVYRRTRAEMPAISEEIQEALEEGVEFHYQLSPLAFNGNERLESLTLAEMEMGEPDDSGRRRAIQGHRQKQLDCDHVLLALGQSVDLSFLPEKWRLEDIFEAGAKDSSQRPSANSALLRIVGPELDETKAPFLLAGDVGTNQGTVPHAIGDGRRVATKMLQILFGDRPDFQLPEAGCAVKKEAIAPFHFVGKPVSEHARRAPEARRSDFCEVDAGLDSGREEALRCFSCGDCTHCDTCLIYCPEGIIHREGAAYAVDMEFCKGCGICVAECPRGAMEMVMS